MASAYDLPVIPHASGPYSYHFVVSQHNSPFQEYLANSSDGKSVLPVFGDLFLNEPIPEKGFLDVSVLDKPGFGLEINPNAKLIDASGILAMQGPRSFAAFAKRKQSIVDEIIDHEHMTGDHIA